MKRVKAKAKTQTSRASAATFGGLALMSSAIAWWFSYYSQWGGPFHRLAPKLDCFSGDGLDCDQLQQFIGPSILPPYSPLLLWLGVVVTILGLFLTRWDKA